MRSNSLLLSKYLFLKGEEVLDDSDAFACGLAISLFQDAAEALIWGIAKELDAQVGENDSLPKLWGKIPEAKLNDKKLELPFKAKIFELNKSRVNFKHYGNLPAVKDAFKFRLYAEDFLSKALLLFFNTSFEEISIADIISCDQLREEIKKAEKLYSEGDYQKAIFSCAVADDMITNLLDSSYPKLPSEFEKIYELFDFEENRRSDAYFIFEKLQEHLENTRSFTLAGLLNMKITDSIKFQKTIPYVFRLKSGPPRFTLKHSDLSQENTDFCIKFITNYAIKCEERFDLE